MRSRLGAAVATAVLCLSLASCTTAGRPVAESASGAPADLERFYTQTVTWGSCGGFGEDLSPELECTRIEVPVDYSKPDGATAKVAMSRVKATGEKIGSLLFNPGGPGGAGLWTATQAGGTPISARFDRIGWDPRGVGASQPGITCLNTKETDAERGDADWDNSPAGIARQEQDHKDFAAKCVERTGKDFLAHIGTDEVVQDMDVMRAVLGDTKLSYVGYSYGTRLGWAYAEKFPRRVRAMVLDGAVDPDKDPVEEALAQVTGFQKVFQDYATSCARKTECPLGQDPEQAAAAFRALTVPLQDKPVSTKSGRPLSYEDALTGVQQALYSPDLWRVLTAGLRELQAGHGDALMTLADMYEGRKDDGSYDNASAAFTAINCVDGPALNDRATVDKLDVQARGAAPFLDDGKGTGKAPLDTCSFWPVTPTSKPHKIDGAKLRAEGLPKLVVVSTTNDPATPYQAGVDLAKQLDAALITFKGSQHTVAFGGASPNCIDRAVIAYLVDLIEPKPGLTC